MVSVEERLKPAIELKPEVASLNMGSMNFGLYPLLDRFREFRHDWEAPCIPRFLALPMSVTLNVLGGLERISNPIRY